jgi:hypothetical protein
MHQMLPARHFLEKYRRLLHVCLCSNWLHLQHGNELFVNKQVACSVNSTARTGESGHCTKQWPAHTVPYLQQVLHEVFEEASTIDAGLLLPKLINELHAQPTLHFV